MASRKRRFAGDIDPKAKLRNARFFLRQMRGSVRSSYRASADGQCASALHRLNQAHTYAGEYFVHSDLAMPGRKRKEPANVYRVLGKAEAAFKKACMR